jgi:hypothetical protein
MHSALNEFCYFTMKKNAAGPFWESILGIPFWKIAFLHRCIKKTASIAPLLDGLNSAEEKFEEDKSLLESLDPVTGWSRYLCLR